MKQLSALNSSRRLVLAILAVGTILTVSGCAGAQESPDSSPLPAAEQATSISIAAAQIVNASPLYIAEQEGFFEDEGLEVTLGPANDVAAAFPALASGDVDFVYTALQPFILATSNGQDMKAVTGMTVSAPGNVAIVTNNPSITSPEDLEGMRVATPTSTGCNLFAIPVLEDLGVDVSSIEWVELLYPNQGPALDQGSIDAACTVEPFITALGGQLGASVVVDVLTGPHADIAIDGLYSTSSFARDNPDTIAKVRAALAKATALPNEDPSVVREIAQTFTQLTPEIAAIISLPAFDSELDPRRVQPVIDGLVDAGAIDQEVNAEDLIAP